MKRWDFVTGALAIAAGAGQTAGAAGLRPRSPVVVVSARDRRDGLGRALALWRPAEVRGRCGVVKPNFHSADPFRTPWLA